MSNSSRGVAGAALTALLCGDATSDEEAERPMAPILLRCPICLDLIDDVDAATPRCAQGHAYDRDGEVLQLVTPAHAAHLRAFDAAVRRDRDAAGLDARPLDHPTLPASAASDPEWAERTADLAFVRDLCARIDARSAVDVGAFNGWLCHALRGDGLDVTAFDLFLDDRYGLGARRHYARRWRGVQLDVCRPELLASQVDLVVLNHGLHFLPRPLELVQGWMRRVAPGGALVVLGLRLHRDPSARRREVEAIAARGRAQGLELFPLAGPGLLTLDDGRRLRAMGLSLQPARDAWRGNLMALLRPQRALCLRGVWRAPAPGRPG